MQRIVIAGNDQDAACRRRRTDGSPVPVRPPPGHSRPRAGFSLIELLAVIVLIAILLSIAVVSAQRFFSIARDKRAALTSNVLATAVHRYRHEYKKWPIPEYAEGVFEYSFTNALNQDCFSMLRRDNETDNPNKIQFLDESSVYVVKDGKMIPLATAGDDDYPLVFRGGDNIRRYFTVTIDVEKETVKVTVRDDSEVTRGP